MTEIVDLYKEVGAWMVVGSGNVGRCYHSSLKSD